ncbi:hypothetical protein IEO21_10391 [Rhodonia placenta]|uniref:HAT C-terminal dimerisation domain-containing protein n=1 Tax=Rhodonia placenta TaxID=104341 RepID=A0A8H7NSW8_9APHY|nr:hypothetical protein IEO21_10391 [Postia placenta]
MEALNGSKMQCVSKLKTSRRHMIHARNSKSTMMTILKLTLISSSGGEIKQASTQHSRIARDYLAIQGSAVSSERTFSSGGRTGTKDLNQLAPTTFEALQIVKDAYRTGVLNTKHNV